MFISLLRRQSVIFRQARCEQANCAAANDDHPLVVCAQSCQKLEPRTVHTSMIFLGSSFTHMDIISMSTISDLLGRDILQAMVTAVHLYDCENARRTFSFQKHGLEFWQLDNNVREAVHQMAAMPTDRKNRINLRQSIVPSLTEWGRRMNLKFNVVVPLDTVCRDTNQ
jgi:hypothetical protein